MAFEISESLRNALLAALASEINGGVLRIYDDSGAVPDSPGDAVGGSNLLITISLNGGGTGLTFEPNPTNGVLAKATSEVWLGTATGSGRASFYRFSSLTDTGAESTTEHRLQGTVGQVNADLLLSDVDITTGDERRIDAFLVGMPEGA